MKNILVTGGSGKAGRATIKLLLEKNYNVFNVDFVDVTDEYEDARAPCGYLVISVLTAFEFMRPMQI